MELRPIHPGKLLKQELEARGLSANKFALCIRVPSNRVSAIINGKRSITAETSLRLGRALGNSPEFWYKLQSHYELSLARILFQKDIESQVSELPN